MVLVLNSQPEQRAQAEAKAAGQIVHTQLRAPVATLRAPEDGRGVTTARYVSVSGDGLIVQRRGSRSI